MKKKSEIESISFIFCFSNRLIPNRRRTKFGSSESDVCFNCNSPNKESETLKHLFVECVCINVLWEEIFETYNPTQFLLANHDTTQTAFALTFCHAIWSARKLLAPVELKKIISITFKRKIGFLKITFKSRLLDTFEERIEKCLLFLFL